MEDKKKNTKQSGCGREEDVLEIALAIVGVTLLMSVVKKIFPCMLHYVVVTPSPVLLMLLHVIIVLIVYNSSNDKKIKVASSKRREDVKRSVGSRSEASERVFRPTVEEVVVDDEEVNAKAEAFIKAFRRQLVFDAVASGL